MYLVKTPELLKPLAKDFLWHIDSSNKEVYFTFDDGPTKGVTEEALDILARYNAKATFFCLGKNAEAHPEIMMRLIHDGHTIGNHTFNHPDGWKTPTIAYLRNVVEAKKHIASNLFRPPYGRITPAQVTALKKQFTLVMWDVLSADFDTTKNPEQCLEHVVKHVTSGSIVVFHDSVKARTNMLYALEGSLDFLTREGYIFRALSYT
jgi:peptidoglycan/xylan/chitin deacetylase (PgdA/CDA1 family)